jgi:uncharacterized protein
MTNISIPPLQIPITEFASQGNALLGIKGSGKSYGATYLAERLMDAGIPIIAFDPIGIWRNLKIAAKGKAYPIVVAHPDNGDLPLTPHSAPEIVRAAMKENISLVIDLYSMHLSKADWRSIVEQCIRILLFENKSLRHLFIEEAAEYVPQRIQPEQGRVYAEIEKLARMGGNASLGYTLINQRAEEVNKAVLEICDCLILHRQKGKNSLTSLGKWLDFADAKLSKSIIQTLPTLDPGQCWIWNQGAEVPTLCRFPEKNTYHPDRRNPQKHVVGKAVDVGEFVAQLSKSLEAILAEAKANDPIAMKSRIRELERALECQVLETKTVEVPAFTAEESELLKRVRTELWNLHAKVEEQVKALGGVVRSIDRATDAVRVPLRQRMAGVPEHRQPAMAVLREIPASRNKPIQIRESRQAGGAALGRCERAILTALAQYPQGRSANQIAVLAGYANSSGGFNNSLASLRTQQFITRTIPMQATKEGLKALGDFNPLPQGSALVDHWVSKLPLCERKILQHLVDIYPLELSAPKLAETIGYSAGSGGFNNALSKLRTLELITRGQPIKASDHLFQ